MKKQTIAAMMLSLTAVYAQVARQSDTRTGPSNGSVSGVVKDAATGKPLADVTIVSNHGRTRTDAEGQYELRDIPAGQWYVDAGSYYRNEPLDPYPPSSQFVRRSCRSAIGVRL